MLDNGRVAVRVPGTAGGEVPCPIQAVRFGKWKAVRNGVRAAVELYDLAADPQEQEDLMASSDQDSARWQQR